MNQSVIIYWAGYLKSNITLDMIPCGTDIVILAFSNTINSLCDPHFLCSIYNSETIKQWVKNIRSKGVKVLMSLIDRPEEHWNIVNMDTFCKSTLELVNEWELDGVDIDGESDMSDEDCVTYFSKLVKNLRNVLPDKIITYTCYTGISSPDGPILKNIKNDIDWIQTMDYFDAFEDIKTLFNDYATIIPENKIAIGVKADVSFTTLDIVKKCSNWNSNKKGIMLWTINRDCAYYTSELVFTWFYTIHENLVSDYIII